MNSVELEKILDTIDITKDAPSQEPERQYYFIKKMRGILVVPSPVVSDTVSNA